MCLDSILTKIGDFIFQNVKKEAITLFFSPIFLDLRFRIRIFAYITPYVI